MAYRFPSDATPYTSGRSIAEVDARSVFTISSSPRLLRGIVAVQAMARGALVRARLRSGRYPGIPRTQLEEARQRLQQSQRPTSSSKSAFNWQAGSGAPPRTVVSRMAAPAEAKKSASEPIRPPQQAPRPLDWEAEARRRAAERVQQQLGLPPAAVPGDPGLAREAEARRRAAERVRQALEPAVPSPSQTWQLTTTAPLPPWAAAHSTLPTPGAGSVFYPAQPEAAGATQYATSLPFHPPPQFFAPAAVSPAVYPEHPPFQRTMPVGPPASSALSPWTTLGSQPPAYAPAATLPPPAHASWSAPAPHPGPHSHYGYAPPRTALVAEHHSPPRPEAMAVAVAAAPGDGPWEALGVARRGAELEQDRREAIRKAQELGVRRIAHRRLQELELQLAEREAELARQQEALAARERLVREAEAQLSLTQTVDAPDIQQEREDYYRKIRLGTVTLADKKRIEELDDREKYARLVHREHEADRLRFDYEREQATKRAERRAELEREKELLREKQRLAMEQRAQLRREEELAMLMEMHHAEWKARHQNEMVTRLQCMYRQWAARQAARTARLQRSIRRAAATRIQSVFRGATARVHIARFRPLWEAERRALWSRIERLDLCEEEERLRHTHEFVERTVLGELFGLFRRDLRRVLATARLTWMENAETVDRRAAFMEEAGEWRQLLTSEQEQRQSLVWEFTKAGLHAQRVRMDSLEAFSRSEVVDHELTARRGFLAAFVHGRLQHELAAERRRHSAELLRQRAEAERQETALWMDGLATLRFDLRLSLEAAAHRQAQRLAKELKALQLREERERQATLETEAARAKWLRDHEETERTIAVERQQFVEARGQQLLLMRPNAILTIQRAYRGWRGRRRAKVQGARQAVARAEAVGRAVLLQAELEAKAGIVGVVLLLDDLDQREEEGRCQRYMAEAQARELLVGLAQQARLAARAAQRRREAGEAVAAVGGNAALMRAAGQTQTRRDRLRAKEREEEERHLQALLRQREQSLQVQAKAWAAELPPMQSPNSPATTPPLRGTLSASRLGGVSPGKAADGSVATEDEPFGSTQQSFNAAQKGRLWPELQPTAAGRLFASAGSPGTGAGLVALPSPADADELRRQRQRLLADLELLGRDSLAMRSPPPLPPLR